MDAESMRRPRRPRRPNLFAFASFSVVVAATACAPSRGLEPPVPMLPFATDTTRSERVERGATLRYFYAPAGPWAIHVLDVNRQACYSAVAVKGFPAAAGRKKTSDLLKELDQTAEVVGGVNADFFSFAPAGVPANAHISQGRIVTGPSSQPVLTFNATGSPVITTLTATGSVELERVPYHVSAWNRRIANGIAIFDDRYGGETDSASSALEIVLDARSRVVQVDSAATGVAIPVGGSVVVARGPGNSLLYRQVMALQPGDSVRALVNMSARPMEAVGGRPVLLRDSAIVREVDTEGGTGFATSRHPRTAVGIANGGQRLMLVVVDGRRKPYSDGMTLRELATLMRALGARDAINLDGGGSSTLVYADAKNGGRLRVANTPSDPTGERAVGNALGVVKGCARK